MSKPIKSALIDAYLEKRSHLKLFLLARFRSESVAEDILQEIYLKLQRSSFCKPVENYSAYLFKVANNLALDFRKKQQRAANRDYNWSDVSTHSLGGEPVYDVPAPEQAIDAKRKLACVRDTLNKLPHQCRRVFILHKLEGHSHAEVASLLGMSRGSVEKHMSKALKQMAFSVQMLEGKND